MADPIVYGAHYSTYTRSVLLALAEKGVAYSFTEVDVFTAGPPPDYLERQPFGRIPALEHDGFRLYETSAILRYVDEAFPGPALQPDDPRKRAQMSQVLGILDSYAYRAMVWDIYLERSEHPGQSADEAKIHAGVATSATCLRAIDALMDDGPYLAGDALTLADLHAVPIFAYLRLTAEGRELIRQNPRLECWWNVMSGRPSVASTRFSRESD
jgi:glutathione S-transferase